MDSELLKKMVLRATDNGAVGQAGEIRAMTPGGGEVSLEDMRAALADLEEDGLVSRHGETWRGTSAAHGAGKGETTGAQRWRLVYAPSLDAATFLHLSYKEDTRSFRLRLYAKGSTRAQIVDVADANNNVDVLRELHPFLIEQERFLGDVEPIDHVDFWVAEIELKNRQILADR